MFCRKCDRAIDARDKYCVYCGARTGQQWGIPGWLKAIPVLLLLSAIVGGSFWGGTRIGQPASMGVVEVRATKVSDGTPLESVSVMVDDTLRESTDASGLATITDLSKGAHTVRLAKDGYTEWTEEVNIAAGQRAMVEATLDLLLLKPQEGSLEIHVVGLQDGKLIDGAKVYIDDVFVANTDVSGVATATDLEEGSHSIKLTKDGYREVTGLVDIVAGQTTVHDVQLESVGPEQDPPLTDLVVQQVTWSPATPFSGNTVTFNVTVMNQGIGVASSSALEYRVDGTQRGTAPLGALAAGATANGSFTWIAEEGTHIIVAVADSDNRIVESDETNNIKEVVLTPIDLGDRTWRSMASGSNRNLNAVWSVSSSDVYAVGDHGTILHYNGSTWSSMASGSNRNLNAVWGVSSSDVYAVGANGTILHYNGSAWSSMTSSSTRNINAVWGTSSSNIYAVGDSGTILRYNGSAWSSMTSGVATNLQGIWGNSSSMVFVVGQLGTLLRFDGSIWARMSSGTLVNLHDLWGSSLTDIYAVGDLGTILHYNGSSWSSMASGTLRSLSGVWGLSPSRVYAVGDNGTLLQYNGTSWTSMAGGASAAINDLWAGSQYDLFAVGSDGTILHYS